MSRGSRGAMACMVGTVLAPSGARSSVGPYEQQEIAKLRAKGYSWANCAKIIGRNECDVRAAGDPEWPLRDAASGSAKLRLDISALSIASALRVTISQADLLYGMLAKPGRAERGHSRDNVYASSIWNLRDALNRAGFGDDAIVSERGVGHFVTGAAAIRIIDFVKGHANG